MTEEEASINEVSAEIAKLEGDLNMKNLLNQLI